MSIACRREGDKLVLIIRDQGCGITPDKLDNIFDPFFSTKPEGEGSGLGLSISLGIIEYHNGTLQIENNPDVGVTAIVVLPLHAFGNNQDRVANG